MAGSFGYELDLNQLSSKEKDEVSKQVAAYKQYQKLIYNGLYYRLSNPYKDNMAVWAFMSENRNEILIQGVVFRARSNSLRRRIRLIGLDLEGVYKSEQDGCTYTGQALMSGGILLPRIEGDDDAFEIYLEKVL